MVASQVERVDLYSGKSKNRSYMSPQPRESSDPSIDFPQSTKMMTCGLHSVHHTKPLFPLQVAPEVEWEDTGSRRSSTSPGSSIAMGIAAMSLRFIIHEDDDDDEEEDNQRGEQEETSVVSETKTLPCSPTQNQNQNQIESIVDSIPIPSSTYQLSSMLHPTCAQPQCQRTIRGPIGSFCKYHKASRFCRVETCQKSAKTGGYCIGHGGGKRCTFLDCTKSAKQGGFCIAHGGGKRCQVMDCTKSALVGGCCSAHGGGHKCSTTDCTKIALVGGFCIAHGGGKRCQVMDCEKSAVGGVCCVAHGGGKRCQALGCRKGAVKSGLCIRHGAKRND